MSAVNLEGQPDDDGRRAFLERVRRRQVPENEVPGVATGPLMLARTGDVALQLRPLEVFSTGVRLELVLLLRRSDVPWPERDAFQQFDSQLFVGVELPGGRKVMPAFPMPWDPRPESDNPALVANGGGGGGRRMALTWFLTPLPEPGDLVVVAAVPGAGLPEARVAVPAAALAEARAEVIELWPWEDEADRLPAPPVPRPPAPEGGWFAET